MPGRVDPETLLDSPEARFEFLLDWEILAEHEDGTVTTTESFEYSRGLYADTYGDVDEATFHRTVAELFDLSESEAATRVEEHGVTREEVVDYLAIRAHVADKAEQADVAPPEPGTGPLALLARMVTEAAPPSPVPDTMRELTDDDYHAFLDEHGDAVVFVWKRDCDPCESMKLALDETLAALPGGVAVAGVDGEAVRSFRESFDVSSAPTTLVFADGELVGTHEGYRSPEALTAAFAAAYDRDGTTD
ncbi:MAG: thioredoxin family protein [Haloarculaceae archaeon]